MAKPINKSIRLSEEVFSYIDSYPGAGFNDKLENIVLFAMKNEDVLKERIRYQQEKLDDIYASVRKLQERYQALNNHLYTALRLNSTFKQLYEDIEKVSQNSLQHKAHED